MKNPSVASRARSLSERLSALLVVSSLTLVTAACGQPDDARTGQAPATTTPASTAAVPPAPDAQPATGATPDNPCAPKPRKKPKNPCE